MKKHKVQRFGSVGILLALVALVMMGSFTLLGTRVESQVFSQINSGLTNGEPGMVPSAPRPKAKPTEKEHTVQPAATVVPREANNNGLEPEIEPTVERTPQSVEVNPFTLTSQDHLSTFGLDVDTASYTSARNYITNGSRPPESEVRVEEFVNYFDYNYPEPQQAAVWYLA